MAGKYYTESHKRAVKKYFDKLKEQGIQRSHGTPKQAKIRAYRYNAIKYIRYLFK